MLFFPPLWRCDPMRVMASSFLRFLDHTRRRTTVGRTPLDDWSARRRDLYLTTHNTHNRQISMPPVRFEPTISAGERPQTYALDRAATGTGLILLYQNKKKNYTKTRFRCCHHRTVKLRADVTVTSLLLFTSISSYISTADWTVLKSTCQQNYCARFRLSLRCLIPRQE